MREQKLRVRLGEDRVDIKEGLHGIELSSGHNVASYVTEVAEVETLEGGNINDEADLLQVRGRLSGQQEQRGLMVDPNHVLQEWNS